MVFLLVCLDEFIVVFGHLTDFKLVEQQNSLAVLSEQLSLVRRTVYKY